jgi:L-threonylcarbamoyladenylate synthase
MNARTIAEAAGIIGRGGLVVYPTDTVYGLGCAPFDESAVERLFIAKGRNSKPIPILCDSIDSAMKLGSLEGISLALARRYWPGAVTIVVPSVRPLPSMVTQGSGEVGLRVPALDLCLSLIRSCGGALAGTSANLSGTPSCRTAAEAMRTLGSRVDLILDGGECRGKESTVVRVVDGEVKILRAGSVAVEIPV